MPLNPAIKPEALNSPVQRANELNDPQFENNQGYFPYDLTHQEFITPLFGQITPTMHLDTVPGDRTVVHDNTKTILNQINGNFLSNLNQYVDCFYVPLRSVYPMNYEKLIPNPTKGDDLPNSALPQIPFGAFVIDYLESEDPISLAGDTTDMRSIMDELSTSTWMDINTQLIALAVGRLTLLATVLSRGQLLDYLGIAYDSVESNPSDLGPNISSTLQWAIDNYFRELYNIRESYMPDGGLWSLELPLDNSFIDFSLSDKFHRVNTLSEWRSALSDIFESGRFPDFSSIEPTDTDEFTNFTMAFVILYQAIRAIFSIYEISQDQKATHLSSIDSESNPFSNGGELNIGKMVAYQQIVAHYYTNDSVDNIFSSDLYMQLLRSVMYPASNDGLTREPVFTYNGVSTEYDYISYGGFFTSLISNVIPGKVNRQYVWLTLVMLLRRSLRYGDYFATARPNLLAIGQLGIEVNSGMVSPIDVTKNLLMQRYLNAVNYCGSQFLNYMASIHGVKPSDTGTFPRFITHRKIELQNQITNNTADDQGKQTTNIVGYSDASAFDVFIDDFGYLISLTSYDVLPIYKSGIESTYHFSDRFDYFNPMLQGIGDQPIRSSELFGDPLLYRETFGYTMRNGEYKYKLSKGHGAFVNSLPGFMLSYPLNSYRDGDGSDPWSVNIDPDFIRDKPVYLDPVIPQQTGTSPADYYHFIVSCTNQVQCARKIQATPGVLF